MAQKIPPVADVKVFGNYKIFDALLAMAYRQGLRDYSQEAIDWFRQKAKTLGVDVTPEDLMADESRLQNQFSVGQMYSYFYIPKHRETLPWYDIFPLIFPVDTAPNGFYGINLHYLPHKPRAMLMDALWDTRNNDRFNDSTKLKISYGILKEASNLKAFRPCFKQYLIKQVASRFMEIQATEWNIALFLPTERFVKASRQQVWTNSRTLTK